MKTGRIAIFHSSLLKCEPILFHLTLSSLWIEFFCVTVIGCVLHVERWNLLRGAPFEQRWSSIEHLKNGQIYATNAECIIQ